METVLYIWLVIIYLWLVCPSKTKETVGNQEIELVEIPIVKLVYQPTIELVDVPIVQLVYNEPCTIKFALLDDDGNLVDTTPEFQAEKVKEVANEYSVLTVAQLRKIAQSYHIKGSRNMRKAQLLESLSQH